MAGEVDHRAPFQIARDRWLGGRRVLLWDAGTFLERGPQAHDFFIRSYHIRGVEVIETA